MPKVGKKHYPCTHAGRRAAIEEAKKQGLKVEYTESTYESISKLMFEAREKIKDVPNIEEIKEKARGASKGAKAEGRAASNKARSSGASRSQSYRVYLTTVANSRT